MRYALLAWLAAQLVWRAWHGKQRYTSFKALTTTEERQQRYRRWLLQSLVFHVALGVVALALVGRVGAIVVFPPELALFADGDGSNIAIGLVVGTVLGFALQMIMQRVRKKPPPTIGDIRALLPRNAAERVYGAALSLAAGVGEEILFRLLLPLLLVLCGVPSLVAVIASVVAFGLSHLYQGVAGIIGTTVAGALFALIYLGSRQLWLAMVFHAIIDLNALVLCSWLYQRRNESGPAPSGAGPPSS